MISRRQNCNEIEVKKSLCYEEKTYNDKRQIDLKQTRERNRNVKYWEIGDKRGNYYRKKIHLLNSIFPFFAKAMLFFWAKKNLTRTDLHNIFLTLQSYKNERQPLESITEIIWHIFFLVNILLIIARDQTFHYNNGSVAYGKQRKIQSILLLLYTFFVQIPFIPNAEWKAFLPISVPRIQSCYLGTLRTVVPKHLESTLSAKTDVEPFPLICNNPIWHCW